MWGLRKGKEVGVERRKNRKVSQEQGRERKQ